MELTIGSNIICIHLLVHVEESKYFSSETKVGYIFVVEL